MEGGEVRVGVAVAGLDRDGGVLLWLLGEEKRGLSPAVEVLRM